MSVYPRRSKRGACAPGASEPLVDLTCGSDADEDDRLTASVDGGSRNVSVSVKWGERGEGEQQKKSAACRRSARGRQSLTSEKFDVGEHIFAWDRGVLYKGKIMKQRVCVDGATKYFVHFFGYKKSHDKWVNADEMLKICPSSNEIYESFRVIDQMQKEGDVNAVNELDPKGTQEREYKVPIVGMRVGVLFDEGKLYFGKITKSKLRRRKRLGDDETFDIRIHYDDGEIEDATYPDPAISLNPRDKSVTGVDQTQKEGDVNAVNELDPTGTQEREYKVPIVGMRVGVLFDEDKLYFGKITKSKLRRNNKQLGEMFDIQIHYDDGDIENATYPNPAICLNPRDESVTGNTIQLRSETGKRGIESKRGRERRSNSASKCSNSAVKAKKKPGKKTFTASRPEVVTSTNATPADYDEDDYAELRQRYLMPRIREKAELATGITLRRQCKGRMIDQNTPGFRMLRARVDGLLKRNDHGEVYRLLCQLRDWEMDPKRIPTAFKDSGDADVEEVLDLTRDDGEGDGAANACIDVDEYIKDVLLVPLQATSNSQPVERTQSSQQGLSSGSKPASDACDDSLRQTMPVWTFCGEETTAVSSEAANDGCDSSNTTGYDEHDYDTLRQRYLMPFTREKATVAGGMTLRRKSKGRLIDRNTPGFRRLSAKVDVLLKKNDHEEVYRLLCQLRNWEMDPRRAAAVFGDGGNHEGILDLSQEDDEGGTGNSCMDVDEYITDVLLMPNEVASTTIEPTADATTTGEGSPTKRQDGDGEPILDSAIYQEKPKRTKARAKKAQNRSHPATSKADMLQITRCGMEEIETYWYSVAETVNRFEPRNSNPADPNCDDLNEDTTNTTVEEQVSPPKSSKRAKKCSTGNSTLLVPGRFGPWNDITKPPGQLTMDECHQFYVHNHSITGRQPSVEPVRFTPNAPNRSLQGHQNFAAVDNYTRWEDIQKPPGQLTIGDCRGFYVRNQPDSSRQSGVRDGRGLYASNQPDSRRQSGIDSARFAPDMPYPGLGDQSFRLQRFAAGFARFAATSNHHGSMFLSPLLQPPMAAQHMSLLRPQGMASTQQHMVPRSLFLQTGTTPVSCSAQHLRSSNAANCDNLKVPPEQLAVPAKTGLEPLLQLAATCETLEHKPGTSSPVSGRKKTAVARVVTPEKIEGEPNILPGGNKRKRGRRKRVRTNPSVVEEPRKKFCVQSLFLSNQKVGKLDQAARFSREGLPKLDARYRVDRTRNGLHGNKRMAVDTFTTSPLIPASRLTMNQPSKRTKTCLHRDWKRQLSQRRKGSWTPSGHLTGKWKPPEWADVKNEWNPKSGAASSAKKYPGCSKVLLPKLDGLVTNFMARMKINLRASEQPSPSNSLHDVVCPQYLKPTFDLLFAGHLAVRNLLPRGDCEDWESVKLARRYYNYWRPEQTKVILLAESHAFTPKERAMHGPGLDGNMLKGTYLGPRGFISLVYCLAYGENEALTDQFNDKTNKGTSQFWTLLAACSRGVDYIANAKSTKQMTSLFAADVLKGGGLPVEDRLQAKLEVLEDLRSRGIWLLDASLFGWYISQPQEYTRSSISNEVHRKPKSRPPKELKVPSLVLSWELFTKHLIKEVANEGHLKLLVPIGMEVEAALTRNRLEDAVRGKSETLVTDTFPAPNAWIPGGYGPFHAKLAALMNEAAPRLAVEGGEVL